MKKRFFLLSLIVLSTMVFGQFCGTDHQQAQLEARNPEIKRARLDADKQILANDAAEFLASKGATFNRNGNYTGVTYTIPVIVHVIEGNGASVTDQQITDWIEAANKQYATTYGNGFFAEGTGADGGTVIPFKLALAKRKADCTTATTGIKRYDGSGIAGYNTYGVRSKAELPGASVEQIRALAPHWNESAYFNIYVVTGFDGNYSDSGLMGWCGFPTNPDASYESVMKMPVVTKQNDVTLAHEFGHGMGLHHPFNGASSDGGQCPSNDNCQTDNDKVCDTEPTQSLVSANPVPSNNDTNPCTSSNYQGVQYNIMNYTNAPKKFTPGQRTRALAQFLQYRGALTTSNGHEAPDSNTNNTITAATCTITGVQNSTGSTTTSYGAGPVKVVLGTINNTSSAINGLGTNAYVDFASRSCINSSFSTTINKGAQSTLKVSVSGGNVTTIKAWIDFNNNGAFEDGEVISNGEQASPAGQTIETLHNFTPPSNAVLNTNLRMRVIADLGDVSSACGDSNNKLNYGQAEDYLVKIVNTLSTNDVTVSETTNSVVCQEGTLTLVGKENFGEYQIFDMSGKLVKGGNTKTNVINVTSLLRGVYVIQFGSQKVKFLKK